LIRRLPVSEKIFPGAGHTLLMVAHGTRAPAGAQTIHELAAALSGHVGPIRIALVDVIGPNPAEVLRGVAGRPIVVPTFLAAGYHVHADLSARIAESGHRGAVVTQTVGPDPELATAMAARLREVGWRPGDAVAMAAVGSSDLSARAESAPLQTRSAKSSETSTSVTSRRVRR
jgi:sirohydrochlorin ferrochelatase